MVPWLLALVGALGAWARIARIRFERRVRADLDAVRATGPAPPRGSALPPLLSGYAARAVGEGAAAPRSIRIEQVGTMRLRPGGPWMPFRAEQRFAVAEPAFVWSARFKLFRVADGLVDGAGRLEARLFGVVPVARASGAETTRAQLLRYLAEIAWCPDAIARNPHLSWTQLGPRAVRGVLEFRGERVELQFHFDERGDIVRVEGLRERSAGGSQVPTPWVGHFTDHAVVGGARIPTRGEVQWILESGPFAYWRGAVTGLRAD